MSQVIVRIQLHGEPSETIYKELHEYMKDEGWSKTITGSLNNKTIDLPHATYTIEYDIASPDLSAIAEEIDDYIYEEIWEGSTTFVVLVETWAIRETKI